MVCFLSYYHKSQALAGRRMWIARFLYPGFSDTFIKWVAFVRPVQAHSSIRGFNSPRLRTETIVSVIVVLLVSPTGNIAQ
ncbi:hypothetical protein IAS59_002658 [Cryptococcus gattii]